jgi:transposase
MLTLWRWTAVLVKRVAQPSFYNSLYDKIPKDHLLRRIDAAVDFGFVNELLADSYCKDFGRPAKEPEMMVKLLLLQRLYGLSDVRLIEAASLNLAFMWFLGLNPEDALPESSLLAKFRTQRLKGESLDKMITETVRQCVDKGILKGGDVGVDTTHICANTTKKVPERIMKHLAKKILAALKADNGDVVLEGVDSSIPDYKQIDDHKKAKEVMKAYLEGLMLQAAPFAKEQTTLAIAEACEVLSDEKFLTQKGLRSLVDKDARVGAKSKTDRFFGYKAEVMMELDGRIITAVDVHTGEYTDGTDFDCLADRTLESGMEVDAVDADKAYFRASILKKAEQMGAETFIPVSASAYRIDEEVFSYNKDSDQWFCDQGNATTQCKRKRRKGKDQDYEFLSYRFDKAQCVECAKRAQCMGKAKGKARELDVSLSAPLFYEESQRQKDPAFVERYKKRSSSEWKNAEMKCHHGMARAKGYGLESVTVQVKLTALAVNCKRMAALVAEQAKKAVQETTKKAQIALSGPMDAFRTVVRRIWGRYHFRTASFLIVHSEH